MTDPTVLVTFDAQNQGPVALYEYLCARGYPCRLIYYLADSEKNRSALIRLVREHSPLLAGLSFASHSTSTALAVSELLRREFPRLPVILGGVHPTIDPLGCVPYCSAVCLGEGEYALLEIVEKIARDEDWRTSGNLIYLSNGNPVRNRPHPLIGDLDRLPIRRQFTEDHLLVSDGGTVPIDRRKYLEMLPDYRVRYQQTFSRGCPNACSYCCNAKFKEIYPNWSKVRTASPAAVIREIDAVLKSNPSILRISLTDDCFLVNSIEWLKDFAGRYSRVIGKGLNFATAPQYVMEAKLRILRGIDLRYIALGLQSGSERVNKFYGRHFHPDGFLAACRLIRSMGIGIVVHVIFDNPWEDEEDVRATLDILTRIGKPFYIMQYSLKVYPGTPLDEHCRKKSIAVPAYNRCFDDYFAIKTTDENRLIILTQFLPRRVIRLLFERRTRPLARAAIRLLYVAGSVWMPFHALRIGGSGRLGENVLIALSNAAVARRWVKNLFSINKGKAV